jgi:hypothetical protein
MSRKKAFEDLNRVDGQDRFTFEALTPGTTPNGIPYVKTHANSVLDNGHPYRRVAMAFGQENIDLVERAIADGGATLSYQVRFLSAIVITGPAQLAQAA